jgi:uncharacterized surface protein with fasciclin (FAS1) repeats
MQQARKIADTTTPANLNRSPTYSLDVLTRKSEQLRRFADCVQAAGLADTFANKGPFTVFAPSDSAFEKLPDGAFDALLRDSAKLKAILSYHVINGFIPAREMKSGEMMTLQGNVLAAAVSPENVKINGAPIVEADLTAINGIIHVIDELLLPPKWRLPGSAGR